MESSATTEETQTAETPTSDATSEQSTQQDSAKTEQPVDLDSLERFRYGGREWTKKELQSAIMRQEDYTAKTQSLSQERKFAENFAFDAAQVMRDPSLFQKFSEIYPKKYVESLQLALGEQLQKAQEKTQATSQAVDPQLEARLKKIESFRETYEKQTHEAQVKANEAQIDQFIKDFSPKYPLADEQLVLARAEVLLQKGADLTQKSTWEKIYKDVHQMHEKKFNEFYKTRFQNQTVANSKSKDAASGGGIPGQAPPRTIKEVDAMVNSMLQQNKL